MFLRMLHVSGLEDTLAGKLKIHIKSAILLICKFLVERCPSYIFYLQIRRIRFEFSRLFLLSNI